MALNAELNSLIIQGNIDDRYIEDIKGIMKIKNIEKGNGEIEIPETEFRINIKA